MNLSGIFPHIIQYIYLISFINNFKDGPSAKINNILQ